MKQETAALFTNSFFFIFFSQSSGLNLDGSEYSYDYNLSLLEYLDGKTIPSHSTIYYGEQGRLKCHFGDNPSLRLIDFMTTPSTTKYAKLLLKKAIVHDVLINYYYYYYSRGIKFWRIKPCQIIDSCAPACANI